MRTMNRVSLPAVLLSVAMIPSISGATGGDWQARVSFQEISVAAAHTSSVGGQPVRIPTSSDWRRVKQEWELNHRRLHDWFRAWPVPSETTEALRVLQEIDKLGRDIEKLMRDTADRQTTLFSARPVPGVTREELLRRVEQVFESRMLHTYGFFLPQSVNEGWGHLNVPGVPFPLYSTPASYCSLYYQAGKDLGDLTERLDPNFFPSKQPLPSICDRSTWEPGWFGLQNSPLPVR
jgi:hypothetical protein